MCGRDYDTPAMMTFSGPERGSGSGREREDTVEERFHEMVQAGEPGGVTVMAAIRLPPGACERPPG